MKLEPTNIAVCKCGSTLFLEQNVCLMTPTQNDQFIPVLTVPISQCATCGVYLDTVRNTDIGQGANLKRYVLEHLPEDMKAKPVLTQVDLNEITGTRKKLFRRIGS